jgi:FkbM family methyltransferase
MRSLSAAYLVSKTATRGHVGDGGNRHTSTVNTTTTTTTLRRGRLLRKKKPRGFLVLLLVVLVSGSALVRLAKENKDDSREQKKSSLEESHEAVTEDDAQERKKTSSLEFTASSCATFKPGLPASSVGGLNNNNNKELVTKLKNEGNSFAINVYQRKDIVSNSVKHGGWEMDKVNDFNRYFINYSNKHNIPLSDLTFVDIGSNIGWFAFAMAALGVKVIAFEPMQENIDLIKESMCLSENLESGVSDRITLFPHGLGVREETCFIYSHNINVGDGHVKCVQKEIELNMPHDYSIKGYIPVHRLDSVVDTQGKNIVLVKMDTEGYEGNVLEGGKKFFLEGGIDVIVTEFVPRWIREKGGDPDEFLKLFFAAGYLALDGEKYTTEAEMMKLANADITLHSSSFMRSLK